MSSSGFSFYYFAVSTKIIYNRTGVPRALTVYCSPPYVFMFVCLLLLHHFFFFFFPGLYLTGHSVSDVFGFVDDVGILIFCGGKTSIAADRRGDFQVWIVSQSKLGNSDYGVNPERIKTMVHEIEKMSTGVSSTGACRNGLHFTTQKN